MCSVCHDPVILKLGRNKVEHFAHENPVACKFAKGESDEHRQCKLEIYRNLATHAHVSDLALEKAVGNVRPDLSFELNGFRIAIEVQISSLSVETILKRTIEYGRENIYVLWLLQWTPDLNTGRYAPKPWERWVHAAYFGRVYYWVKGATVVSYRFEPHFKTIPRKLWYSAGGKQMRTGGYSQKSKRFCTAIRDDTFDLATDFIPRQRYWWQVKDLKLPDAKLFMDSKSGFPASEF
ncbi:MAG TPA: competence protein CoiA family protein [Candidatus Dormibacteraeota bacterium]|nr:competence protein CoiA family protein [Candidatus Dormibacteraeota bacterium]